MTRISLIIPLSSDSIVEAADIESYRNTLQGQAGPDPVEVILAGPSADALAANPGIAASVVSVVGDGRVDCMRAGLRVASGDYLVVLDPRRSYPPEALRQIVEGLT